MVCFIFILSPWRLFELLFLKTFYLFIFREEKEGDREREKHQCVVASRAPPTGELTHNPGMCPDWELNQRPFGSQAWAQSTELHQPGLSFLYTWSLPLHRNSQGGIVPSYGREQWGLQWMVSRVRIHTKVHVIHAAKTGHLIKAESIIQSLTL